MPVYRKEIIKDNYVRGLNPQIAGFAGLEMGAERRICLFYRRKTPSGPEMDVWNQYQLLQSILDLKPMVKSFKSPRLMVLLSFEKYLIDSSLSNVKV